MIDESDDVTTWRFHRVSGLAVIGSALLHATALAALLPAGKGPSVVMPPVGSG